MSSRIHLSFALAAGSTLEDRPVYLQSRCFLPFPFPLCGKVDRARIRKLAEELDTHRKRAQARHGLTLTGLYNVLEKLRFADPGSRRREEADGPGVASNPPPHVGGYGLTAREKLIHDQGLVSVLQQLHEDLDAAVFAAYGWPASLTDAEILERLVALNAERAAEEARGLIHWLRPEYQAGGQGAGVRGQEPGVRGQEPEGRGQKLGGRSQKSAVGAQEELIFPGGKNIPKADRKTKIETRKVPWPKSLAERVQAVERALHAAGTATTAAELAQTFLRAQPADVAEILETLASLGRARRRKDGQFAR